MAKCEMKMPNEFLDKLSKLGDRFDKAAPKILQSGGKVVLSAMKANLEGRIGKDTKYPSRSKGDLLRSLGITPALQDRNGEWNIRVGVGDSIDREGVPNALKAQVLEYGKIRSESKALDEAGTKKSEKACRSSDGRNTEKRSLIYECTGRTKTNSGRLKASFGSRDL